MHAPEKVQLFAVLVDDVSEIIRHGKLLGLVITHSGNKKHGHRDRVWFGLPKKIRAIVSSAMLRAIPDTLFRFNRRVNGLYHASDKNGPSVELYRQYWKLFQRSQRQTRTAITATPRQRQFPKVWLTEDIRTLVESRSRDNPPTFRHVAYTLNRTHERLGTVIDRKFEARDCSNKWACMFPSAMDTNQTLQHLRELKKKWPGLIYGVQLEQETQLGRPPALIGLHIVWPWAKEIMGTLSPSIFCDATYNVTIYTYKVVMITTLDGNKRHRPLMVSFITRSTNQQWCYIFNIFARHVAPQVEQVYAVTSDKEKAISGVLAMSVLSVASQQVLCGLHAKWNVSKHKCVDHRLWHEST